MQILIQRRRLGQRWCRSCKSPAVPGLCGILEAARPVSSMPAPQPLSVGLTNVLTKPQECHHNKSYKPSTLARELDAPKVLLKESVALGPMARLVVKTNLWNNDLPGPQISQPGGGEERFPGGGRQL